MSKIKTLFLVLYATSITAAPWDALIKAKADLIAGKEKVIKGKQDNIAGYWKIKNEVVLPLGTASKALRPTLCMIGKVDKDYNVAIEVGLGLLTPLTLAFPFGTPFGLAATAALVAMAGVPQV